MSSPDFTVVGSGLVGSLMSLFLARRGYRVSVLERRPDPRGAHVEAGRSINLAISVRGLHALGRVGLEHEALAHAIPMRGRMIHGPEGDVLFQPYGKDETESIHSISRAWLNRLLIEQAERSGAVEIRFGQRVTDVDLRSGALTVEDETAGRTGPLRDGPVLGTDGASSVLRRALAAAPGESTSEERLTHGYKEISLPAGPGGQWQLEKNALHIWPRHDFMLIALPNEDGSFTCTLFLAHDGPASFELLRTPERIRDFFEWHFADVVPLVPDLESQFTENPTGGMVTVKCFPWHSGGNLLLLGDAAHAIVPFLGQGMNFGFEDCEVLDEVLATHPDRGRAFAEFSRRRKPDADAIAEMAVENFVEMRDTVTDPRFLLEKQIEIRLLEALPGRFVSRYGLVSFSRVPFRIAEQAGAIAEHIVSELAEDVSSADEVDLSLAAALVDAQLTPFVKKHMLFATEP